MADKCNMKEMAEIKRGLEHWNKGKGDLRAGPHPDKHPTCVRKRPKEFSTSRKEQVKAACRCDSSGPAGN